MAKSAPSPCKVQPSNWAKPVSRSVGVSKERACLGELLRSKFCETAALRLQLSQPLSGRWVRVIKRNKYRVWSQRSGIVFVKFEQGAA